MRPDLRKGRPTARRGIVAITAAATAMIAVGLGVVSATSGGATTAHASDGAKQSGGHNGWEDFWVNGLEAEHYDSIEEMAQTSDMIVSGRFAPTGKARESQGDTPEDVTTFVVGSFEVTEMVSGSRHKVGDRIPVEFMAPAHVAKNIPTEQVVLFLREMNRPGVYRTVVQAGLWTESPGDEIDAPVATAEAGEEVPFHAELHNQDIGNLPDLVEYVEDVL